MNTVGVLARPGLREAGPVVEELVGWLYARGIRVCLDQRTAELVPREPSARCVVAAGREMARLVDALVVLGGDGTLLAASRLLEKTIPVLGVNFGSLGFLTEIALGELYPTLQGVLEGRSQHEERRLLRARISRRGRPEATADVLNDVVITKAGPSRIIEVDLAVDGLFVSSFRADGLIVSSPTGSTAYNLAAGGPILHPTLPALVVTPICPHMLTNRPLVLSDESRVEVRLRAARDVEVYAALDGQETFAFADGDSLEVSGSPRRLLLVKAPGRDYYQVLRSKLKWGDAFATERQR
ncbi:MAG TPA: NAD(+)/NADH kinase [Vicinamibacteria bacterium]|nr:NAD(+)/NADH kinase [Vicinamibacteria bacterium]